MRAALFILAAVGVAIAGCSASEETAHIPPLKSTGANCSGHFKFQTEQYGTGQSDCRNGRGVAFSAKTEDRVAAGLVCNYALYYATNTNGTGELACSDGSTGVFKFEEDSTHRQGRFSVKLKDGRAFRFTYSTVK